MEAYNFIDGILNDYEYCLDNDAFISCKDVLESLASEPLDEAVWDNQYNNKWRHYQKHVCDEGEPYSGRPFDNYGRIRFPRMSFGKYLGQAERLADTVPVSSEMTDGGVFGWKATVGWMKSDVCVKFRKSDLKSADGKDLYEYVAYRPVNGNPRVKDVGGSTYTYYDIDDRIVFSYGLTEDPAGHFKRTASLSPAELKEELVGPRLIRITESILTEANRQQLLQKSRNAQNYSIHNQDKGKNRYERRNKSSISATVRDYNMIQMDPLFKRDILEFRIPVIGETDVYVVDVRVDGLLEEVRKQVMANKGKLEFKVILQSLMKVLNIGNVYIGCSCPDSRYRMAYWQTKDNYRAGYKERRPSNITNPNDTLGAGCKHVMLILANLDWAVKVASVINNYIKWCKEHMPSNYADYIFPKVYGTKYDKAVQLQLFGDTGLFPSDVDTMKQVIDRGMRGKDVSGRFSKGNEMRFQKKDLETPPEDNPDQMHIDFDGGQDDEEGGSGE